MSLDPHKFKTLKQKMMQDEDVYEVTKYFLDHFSDDPDLFDQSKPAKHALLESIIRQVGDRFAAVEGKATIHRFAMMSIPRQQFFHGACMINRKWAGFIYFDDIRTGCVGIASTLSGPTDFIRFSASIQRGPD